MNAAVPYGSHQQHAYIDSHAHLPSHGHTPVSGAQYAHYPQATQHMVQPTHYATPSYYGNYQPTPSPQTASHASSHYTGQSQPSLATMSPANPPPPPEQVDQTGQVAPPGPKPKVTATLWEDEGTLCFQIEAKGICVARREDNHMINGTKLLNVAQMTRGRRDGILKSEKVRNVVKIGPMHLKGVWIPFERALEFANKEKITACLFPLFVHNIGALLHHPSNRDTIPARASAARRQADEQNQQSSQYKTPTQTTQAPPLLHSHSMTQTVGSHGGNTSQSLAPHPSTRPGLDRAHTFPTPPTSASSAIGLQHGSHEWSGYAPSTLPAGQPLAIDTSGLGNTRSMPTTPASTPPGGALQSMQPYQTQAYDSRQHGYATSHGQYPHYQPSVPSQPEYAQSHPYAPDRGAYTYNPNPNPAPTLHSEHMTPDSKASPSHHPSSGRATPRTIATPGSQWQQHQSTYPTPQRGGPLPASNLYNVTSDSRPTQQPNGYPAATATLPSSGGGAYTYPNSGAPPSNKRMREVEDEEQHDQYQRAASQGSDPGGAGLKRRRTARENSAGAGAGRSSGIAQQTR